MPVRIEDVREMKSGRELDRVIGGVIMGLDIVEDTLPQLPKYYLPEYERTVFRDVPFYSSSISDAWEVVEKMRTEYKKYVTIHDNAHLNYDVRFSGFHSPEFVRLSSLPEAICKAAVLAYLE